MTQSTKRLKPAALAIGATFAVSMAASSFATAATPSSNPFAMSDLHSGYSQLAEKANDAKCGANKKQAEEKAKEGKCGDSKAKAAPKDGKCGASKPAPKEGKCGGSK